MLNKLDLTRVADDEIAASLPRPNLDDLAPEELVSEIIADVRGSGDKALIYYAEKYDGRAPELLAVPDSEIASALDSIPNELREALQVAANRIEKFHQTQTLEGETTTDDGITVETRHQPVLRAGCYVPGGRAAYPSTLLMTAIPAKVAGVNEVIVCVPPDASGSINPATLAAAKIAGVTSVYAIGGAQAVAAMAYGTETIPAVDVIVGPGNIYVTLAKKNVYGKVGIDSLAGPSEILIIADQSAKLEHVASDMLAQAEHDPLASSILLTTNSSLIDKIDLEIVSTILKVSKKKNLIKYFK